MFNACTETYETSCSKFLSNQDLNKPFAAELKDVFGRQPIPGYDTFRPVHLATFFNTNSSLLQTFLYLLAILSYEMSGVGCHVEPKR